MKLVQPVTILIIRQSEYLKDFLRKLPVVRARTKRRKEIIA